MKAIVASEQDKAGMNIHSHLLDKGFESTKSKWQGKTISRKGEWLLVKTESRIIYADEVKGLDADEIIFISKHSSESGKPTLTTHLPGNFGTADYGGEPGELCKGRADRMKEIYSHLVDPPFDYSVSLEVTHHGPFIPQPCMFVELGSTEEQWGNQEAAEYIADAVVKGIDREPQEVETGIGIGGNHYAPKFTEVEENREISMGHMVPKYAQNNLDEEMVEQMISKTSPEPEKIFIDKKGTRGQSKVREMLEEFDKEVILL